MADRTKIKWADATWQPVVGCSKISPGCANCYAEKMAVRLAHMGQGRYRGVTDGHGWAGKISCADRSVWDQPRRWRKPRRIFVCSMGDLFHESSRYEYWRDVVGVATDCPQHKFLLLTKRAGRMRESLESCSPTPNVWAGVTCEDQQRADVRLPDLLATPAAVRWVSCEPLIDEVLLWAFIKSDLRDRSLVNLGVTGHMPGINWVVIGAESGPNRRPCNIDWVRSLVHQCQDAGVAVFVKQLNINGRVSKDPAEWAENLRVREWPR